jgi:hypothetical protein
MSLFSRLKQPKGPQNIPVYYVSAIVDGNVKASPLGTIHRFSDDFENAIKRKHHPRGTAYINENINEVSVILFWNADRVDAISFLSADEARIFPSFNKIPDEDLSKMDKILIHFPR